MMNEAQVKRQWRAVKGSAKENWGRLTGDNIEMIDGQLDQLSGAIQKRYGRTKQDANREIREWSDSALIN